MEVRGGIPRIILSSNTFPTWGGSTFFPQGCSLQARARAEKQVVYRGGVRGGGERVPGIWSTLLEMRSGE